MKTGFPVKQILTQAIAIVSNPKIAARMLLFGLILAGILTWFDLNSNLFF